MDDSIEDYRDAPIGVVLALAKIDAKLDVALAQHSARLDEYGKAIADHEGRLRKQEERKTIAPWQLWTAVIGSVTLLEVVLNILDRISNS